MKILVVSDNHGDKDILVNIFNKYKGNVDAIFHCGDSELPSNDSIWTGINVVGGNCDYDSGYAEELTVNVGDETVFMGHGHFLRVRFSLDQLKNKAKEGKATIALYGHTHDLHTSYSEGILFLNPGSIRLPRGKYPYQCYAIINSTTDSYSVSYYNRNHEEISELTSIFYK